MAQTFSKFPSSIGGSYTQSAKLQLAHYLGMQTPYQHPFSVISGIAPRSAGWSCPVCGATVGKELQAHDVLEVEVQHTPSGSGHMQFSTTYPCCDGCYRDAIGYGLARLDFSGQRKHLTSGAQASNGSNERTEQLAAALHRARMALTCPMTPSEMDTIVQAIDAALEVPQETDVPEESNR